MGPLFFFINNSEIKFLTFNKLLCSFKGYGGSEEVLGKCLQGRRKDAIVASKFGFREGVNTPPYTAQQIDEAITKSLNKLQTDYLDIMQVSGISLICHALVLFDQSKLLYTVTY